MAVTVEERFESRDIERGNSPRAILRYVIKDTDDHAEALSNLAATAPTLFDGLPRLKYKVIPVGPKLWYGEAQYNYPTKQETGIKLYQFDTGGGTQHITQSLGTVQRYARTGYVPPNFLGAVGVSQNNVDGVDIVVPVYHFSEVNYESNSQVDVAYKQTLFTLTGRVNNDIWNGYAAGEVLFLGAAGSMRAGGDWEITYRFAASPNLTSITIGDITGIAKKGWEYLWVQYLDGVDNDAYSLIKRPHSVHIEQVYPVGDFSDLHV
jgi:hypothetical protein